MLSSARGPPPSALLPGGRGVILHYKFLALAENVVIDVVLHGDEYDDWDGTNHDDNNAADAGNDCPRGGGCCRRQLQAGSSRHSRPSAGAGATCHFGSSCHCRTPSAMSGGGGYGRGLRRRTCCRREDNAATMESVVPRQFAFACRPIAPRPSLRLAGAALTMCSGEGSPLAMKRLIRTTCSASSGGGVRRHLLLYNSANRL